ncbi:MAG TPA: cytidylate kinase-like family protein [Candidatus Limnocylindrales bacterium]|jgi:cytidylate kinase|nr:cytidylate kinase-like family protein [Candidatus Limnocylindrales bacterium]
MKIRVITVEREYGSGGANIARKLAARLGWKFWDTELTQEIARVANVDPRAAALCDERRDPLLYRLFKVYARGSYERALPLAESGTFDTDRMVELLHQVIKDVASRGECVIVGRGSPYILRNRPDAFHVFVYAPVEEKVRRIMSLGKSEKEAAELVKDVDTERADFIRHYFGAQWPGRWLYNLMINSKFGDDFAVDRILDHVAALERLLTLQGVTA